MALETKLVQKLSQSLLMTPQLQQAIKLLQLGRLEYIEAIQKELLENPVLEEQKEDDGDKQDARPKEQQDRDRQDLSREDSASDTPQPKQETEIRESNESPVAWEDYLESFSDYRGASTPKGFIDHSDKPSLEATLSKEETLPEYLVSQIRMHDLSEQEMRYAYVIVGNLDKNGYLSCTLEELAESAGISVERISEVLGVVQSLDPPGVGAQNLSECLWLQLDAMGLGTSLKATLVRDHLDKLEKRKYDQIAKEEGVEVEVVYEAVKAIQNLEPRPGRPFADDAIRYIVPDIYVYKVGGEYVISLNEDGLPKLRVSPYYLELLKNGDEDNAPSRAYLNERLKAASWLIKSIHQRQQTIYRVTEAIVEFQREFFDDGIAKLKPLVLRDVADKIGMHESTVSRVTTNKYVHTPQGVYELKFFFSTGIKTGDGEVSSSSIKEKIKNIIASEPAESPVSDQQIVDMLQEESIKIARRTVAKYRESMGILSSSKRKRLF